MEAFGVGEVVYHAAWTSDHYMWLLGESESLVHYIEPAD